MFAVPLVHAEDGYRLWLRYDRIADDSLRTSYAAALPHIILATPEGAESPTLEAAVRNPALGDEGYALGHLNRDHVPAITIVANRDIGVLYGVFDLLRRVQTHESLENLNVVSVPKIQRRLLNHWDDLRGFVGRGYAGHSLWR